MNTRGYIDRVKSIVMEHLRQVGGPPSVQMQGDSIQSSSQVASNFLLIFMPIDVPRGPLDAQMDDPNEDDDLIPPDVRRPQRLLDSRRQADGELSDSDDEGEGDRRDHTSHREPDVARRFGTATGIMQTGSTHGIGPTIALPVSSGATAATAGGSGSADEDMEVDDDDAPLSQTVKAKSKKAASPSTAANASAASDAETSSMAVDPPTSSEPDAHAAGEAAPASTSS